MLRKFLIAATLLCLIVTSSSALFHFDFFRGHDYVHAARIVEMTRALQDGHVIPRWSQNFGYGYGMPLFEFYAPLPFFIGSLGYMAGLSLIQSVGFIFLLSSVITIIGSFLLGKYFFGSAGGLLSATLIGLAPYRAVNLYVRGAISESWGLMTLPWIMLGIALIIDKKKYGFQILVIGLVALFTSHNLSALLSAIPLALWTLGLLINRYVTIITGSTFSWKLLWQIVSSAIRQLLVAVLLGIGISAFYIFPALVEQHFTKVEKAVTSGFFDLNLHFLYIRQFFQENWGYGGSIWGPEDDLSFFIGYPQLILLVLSSLVIGRLLLLHVSKKQPIISTKQPFILFFTASCIAVLALFFCIIKSQTIWNALSFSKFVQFPWRWLTVSTVFIGFAGSAIAWFMTSDKFKFLVVGFTVVSSVWFAQTYFHPESYLEDHTRLYYSDPTRIRTEMSGTLYDYVPKQISSQIKPARSLIMCPEYNYDLLCEHFTIVVERTHEKVINFNLPQDDAITFSIADYPGWKAFIDGQEVEYTQSKEGLLRFVVPQGEHQVTLQFQTTPVRQVSDIVSTVSLAIFVVISAYSVTKYTKTTS